MIPKSDDFSFEQAVETLDGLSGGDIAQIATNCMVKVVVSSEHKLTNDMLKVVVDNYHKNKAASKAYNSREVTGKEKEDVLNIINK